MNKTNVGILTFYAARNLGEALQEYALFTFVNRHYLNAEVIKYESNFLKNKRKIITVNNYSILSFIKSIVLSFLFLPFNVCKEIKYRKFKKKYINTSSNYYKDKIEFNDYMYYLVGSDQVWNLDLTNNDKSYFLPFINRNIKKVSYAASFGKNTFDKSKNEIYYKLNDFNYISIREETSKKILENMLPNKKIYRNIDPVFLLNNKEWECIASRRKFKYSYVLIYSFKHVFESIELAKKMNKKIIYIGNIFDRSIISLRDVGPKDFISLIINADYVITDSYHCIAFSIIFNKPFSVFLYDDKDCRIKDLLALFDLESRIVKKAELNVNQIDYIRINKQIEIEKIKSFEYFNLVFKNK